MNKTPRFHLALAPCGLLSEQYSQWVYKLQNLTT